MKHFLQKILTCMFVCITCAFGAIDSANAAKFTVNTSATNSFQFNLSARGTFHVNCGPGGTLGSDNSTAAAMISGATINKNDTTNYTFKCSYSDSVARTIGFDGTATGYSTTNYMAAISFSGNTSITSVSGNLSAIFPYISGNAQNGAQPRFYRTFYDCYFLTSIPSTLFENYTTGAQSMFQSTFSFSGLTSIPSGLFSNITTGYRDTFNGTFAFCSRLTSIPSGLFSNITTITDNGAAFNGTFYNCTKLTGYISPTLFAGLIANNAPTSVFSITFTNSSKLATSCSSGTEYASTYKTAWGGKVSCTEGLFVSYSCGSHGTGNPSDSSVYAPGATVTPPSSSVCTPSSGYSFNKWSCRYGANSQFNAGATFTMPSTYVVCTAQYTAINYTVSFAAGTHGSGSMSPQTNKHVGDTITLPANEFTPSSGYVFNGWSCDNNVGSVSSGGTFTMPAANTTCTAQWVRFIVNTSATNSFQFNLSAQGTFTVDCGTGGTLGSNDSTAAAMISGATINKNDTTNYTFKCTYSGSSSRTIGFDGTAEGYNTDINTAAISFFRNTLITSVSGNLSAIFPYILGNAQNGAQPRFYQTFYNCTRLTSIPGTLFANYTTGATFMFAQTFFGCTGLTSIPSDLFSHITTGATYMFNYTFNGCTGLTSIPSGLFSSNFTTGAHSMFRGIFSACTGLTSIPSDLFSSFTTGAQYMFAEAFVACTGLESIPSGLFSNITTGASYMFYNTFRDCSKLTGYIPPTLFAGLIANNAATTVFSNTFTGTGMDPSCDTGMAEYAPQYTSAWGGKVSCKTAYTITYSCGSNGTGTPTDSNSPYIDGATVTALTSSACTASNGYTFNSWSCDNNVGSVSSGGTFTMPAAAVTCTAQWALNTVNLTWYGEDGTTTLSGGASSCTYGGTITPLPTAPAKPGYHFTKWKIIK